MRQQTAGVKNHSFVMLAPSGGEIPISLRDTLQSNPQAHSKLLSDVQILRGRIAVREGAVSQSLLDGFGRHHMPGDLDSWHLVKLDKAGRIRGCARILVHSHNVKFADMRLAHSEIAKNPLWHCRVRTAVEADIVSSKKRQCILLEPGGWVVEEDCRGGKDAATIALSAIACSQFQGNCVAYLTATVKHGSSAILRRLGAKPLMCGKEELPRYYDPTYGCDMELLRLDACTLNRRFEVPIRQIQEILKVSLLLQAGSQHETVTRLAA